MDKDHFIQHVSGERYGPMSRDEVDSMAKCHGWFLIPEGGDQSDPSSVKAFLACGSIKKTTVIRLYFPDQTMLEYLP